MVDDDEIRKRIVGLPDEDLLAIVSGPTEDYTPFARQVAADELANRGGVSAPGEKRANAATEPPPAAKPVRAKPHGLANWLAAVGALYLAIVAVSAMYSQATAPGLAREVTATTTLDALAPLLGRVDAVASLRWVSDTAAILAMLFFGLSLLAWLSSRVIVWLRRSSESARPPLSAQTRRLLCVLLASPLLLWDFAVVILVGYTFLSQCQGTEEQVAVALEGVLLAGAPALIAVYLLRRRATLRAPTPQRRI